MKKIAVTSRSFSNNATLRNELLCRYPNVLFNETSTPLSGSQLSDFLRDAEGVIVGLEKIDKELLDLLPNLKVISKYGVGLDGINLRDLRQARIMLGWTPGINRRAVSELALALILISIRRLNQSSKSLLAGNWAQHVGALLSQKVVGIIGLGNIGRDLVDLLKPFDCSILAFDKVECDLFSNSNQVRYVCLEDLLISSDVVTIHLPLTTETRGLIGKNHFSMMKKTSLLINTARGGIISEADLLDALNNEVIAGAALDVYEVEPPQNLELIHHERVYSTSHIGGSASEAILAMGRAAIEGLSNAAIPTEALIRFGRWS